MTIELTEDIIKEVLINNSTKAFKDIHKAVYICKARLEGRTYKDIGTELNISPSRARDYVVRTMAIYRQRKRKEQLRERRKMTNYDKIRNMSIDEMAKFLAYEKRAACTGVSAYKCYHCDDCTVCSHKWLESEVEE